MLLTTCPLDGRLLGIQTLYAYYLCVGISLGELLDKEVVDVVGCNEVAEAVAEVSCKSSELPQRHKDSAYACPRLAAVSTHRTSPSSAIALRVGPSSGVEARTQTPPSLRRAAVLRPPMGRIPKRENGREKTRSEGWGEVTSVVILVV